MNILFYVKRDPLQYQTPWNILTRPHPEYQILWRDTLKHNRISSGELLAKDRRAVGSTQLGLNPSFGAEGDGGERSTGGGGGGGGRIERASRRERVPNRKVRVGECEWWVDGGGGFVKLSRTAFHTMTLSVTSKQFWLNCILERLFRRKALRQFFDLRALPVYPVFEDEKSNESDEKSVKPKIALKKTTWLI